MLFESFVACNKNSFGAGGLQSILKLSNIVLEEGTETSNAPVKPTEAEAGVFIQQRSAVKMCNGLNMKQGVL